MKPIDQTVFTATAAAVLAVGVLASFLPARSASRVDPLIVLRDSQWTPGAPGSHQVRDALSAFQMLAAATKFGLLARFLAVLTAVLAIGTVLRDRALAARVRALVGVSHERVTSRPLYVFRKEITSASRAEDAAIACLLTRR
ncbi:MAG: hypothetical protein ACM3SQ_08165 [Betaproteobacteria bacterium]